MAEQVQAILERMVPYLKDLRNRNLFTSDEIRLIVERRRRSEYLLQRRSQAQISDYLRYIEDELHLERLRKLRKEKVLTELENEEKEKKRRMWMSRNSHNGEDDDDDETTKKGGHKTEKNVSSSSLSYQTSGPGDAHILSHVHFLYQRTLKKFHYPLEILLNYAEFSKEVKSFHMLSRVYAMGMQHHPREAGLWIEAASFEYFGYVAQDYESNKNGKKEGGVNSKIVGSSIKNARVLMQRGLRINKTSTELWLQYFALELHYVQKLRGRKEILLLESSLNDVEEEEDRIVAGGDGDEEGGEQNMVATLLLPCQVIFKNAILAIPNDIRFRLRFVEACRMFPDTSCLEAIIMTSIQHDFGTSVEGWVARISYAEEQMKNRTRKNMNNKNVEGFLGRKFDTDDDGDGGDDANDYGKSSNVRPMKKARFNNKINGSNSDVALELLQQAIETAPSPKLYLECARFLRMRIQGLLEYMRSNSDKEVCIDDDDDYVVDVTYLIQEGENAGRAAQRLTCVLEELYESAKKKNVSSTTLTLDYVDFLLSVDQTVKAEQLLSSTITSMADVDVPLWLRWVEISRQLEGSLPSLTSPVCILRQALKRTPLHHRYAHTLVLTELMQQLMAKPSSQKTTTELQSLFQKLILLSQGLSFPPSSSEKEKEVESDVNVNNEFGGAVNVASAVLAYFNYTILNNNTSSDDDFVRSIYTSLIYHSNYGKSCDGKTQDEMFDMKSLFDACIRFEKDCCCSTSAASANTMKTDGKKGKMARKIRLNKLYTAAIGFFSNGSVGIMWRNVVNSFQRDLDDLKCGL